MWPLHTLPLFGSLNAIFRPPHESAMKMKELEREERPRSARGGGAASAGRGCKGEGALWAPSHRQGHKKKEQLRQGTALLSPAGGRLLGATAVALARPGLALDIAHTADALVEQGREVLNSRLEGHRLVTAVATGDTGGRV